MQTDGETMLMYVNVGEQHRESGNEQFMLSKNPAGTTKWGNKERDIQQESMKRERKRTGGERQDDGEQREGGTFRTGLWELRCSIYGCLSLR